MKLLYRVGAVILTLLSAGISAILISVATDDNREIRVVNFTLFAVGAVIALVVAVILWRRASSNH
jgi:ABC-type sugar transport system permease subunit